MVAITKGNSLPTRFVGMDNTTGQMENIMMANGFKTKCMGMEFSSGKTLKNMKVNLLMIKGKVGEHFHGQMEGNILESGNQESSMVKALI